MNIFVIITLLATFLLCTAASCFKGRKKTSGNPKKGSHNKSPQSTQLPNPTKQKDLKTFSPAKRPTNTRSSEILISSSRKTLSESGKPSPLTIQEKDLEITKSIKIGIFEENFSFPATMKIGQLIGKFKDRFMGLPLKGIYTLSSPQSPLPDHATLGEMNEHKTLEIQIGDLESDKVYFWGPSSCVSVYVHSDNPMSLKNYFTYFFHEIFSEEFPLAHRNLTTSNGIDPSEPVGLFRGHLVTITYNDSQTLEKGLRLPKVISANLGKNREEMENKPVKCIFGGEKVLYSVKDDMTVQSWLQQMDKLFDSKLRGVEIKQLLVYTKDGLSPISNDEMISHVFEDRSLDFSFDMNLDEDKIYFCGEKCIAVPVSLGPELTLTDFFKNNVSRYFEINSDERCQFSQNLKHSLNISDRISDFSGSLISIFVNYSNLHMATTRADHLAKLKELCINTLGNHTMKGVVFPLFPHYWKAKQEYSIWDASFKDQSDKKSYEYSVEFSDYVVQGRCLISNKSTVGHLLQYVKDKFGDLPINFSGNKDQILGSEAVKLAVDLSKLKKDKLYFIEKSACISVPVHEKNCLTFKAFFAQYIQKTGSQTNLEFSLLNGSSINVDGKISDYLGKVILIKTASNELAQLNLQSSLDFERNFKSMPLKVHVANEYYSIQMTDDMTVEDFVSSIKTHYKRILKGLAITGFAIKGEEPFDSTMLISKLPQDRSLEYAMTSPPSKDTVLFCGSFCFPLAVDRSKSLSLKMFFEEHVSPIFIKSLKQNWLLMENGKNARENSAINDYIGKTISVFVAEGTTRVSADNKKLIVHPIKFNDPSRPYPFISNIQNCFHLHAFIGPVCMSSTILSSDVKVSMWIQELKNSLPTLPISGIRLQVNSAMLHDKSTLTSEYSKDKYDLVLSKDSNSRVNFLGSKCLSLEVSDMNPKSFIQYIEGYVQKAFVPSNQPRYYFSINGDKVEQIENFDYNITHFRGKLVIILTGSDLSQSILQPITEDYLSKLELQMKDQAKIYFAGEKFIEKYSKSTTVSAISDIMKKKLEVPVKGVKLEGAKDYLDMNQKLDPLFSDKSLRLVFEYEIPTDCIYFCGVKCASITISQDEYESSIIDLFSGKAKSHFDDNLLLDSCRFFDQSSQIIDGSTTMVKNSVGKMFRVFKEKSGKLIAAPMSTES